MYIPICAPYSALGTIINLYHVTNAPYQSIKRYIEAEPKCGLLRALQATLSCLGHGETKVPN
jgi:hypothetical protein